MKTFPCVHGSSRVRLKLPLQQTLPLIDRCSLYNPDPLIGRTIMERRRAGGVCVGGCYVERGVEVIVKQGNIEGSGKILKKIRQDLNEHFLFQFEF